MASVKQIIKVLVRKVNPFIRKDLRAQADEMNRFSRFDRAYATVYGDSLAAREARKALRASRRFRRLSKGKPPFKDPHPNVVRVDFRKKRVNEEFMTQLQIKPLPGESMKRYKILLLQHGVHADIRKHNDLFLVTLNHSDSLKAYKILYGKGERLAYKPIMAGIEESSMKVYKVISEKAPPGAKYERMVKHIKGSHPTEKQKEIAYATAWKNYNKHHVHEGLRRNAAIAGGLAGFVAGVGAENWSQHKLYRIRARKGVETRKKHMKESSSLRLVKRVTGKIIARGTKATNVDLYKKAKKLKGVAMGHTNLGVGQHLKSLKPYKILYKR